MSNIETFDLRQSSKMANQNTAQKPPTPASTLPEIHTVKKSSSKGRRRHRKRENSEPPRCRESNCEVCRILKEDFEWITNNNNKQNQEINGEEPKNERFSLNQIGLNPQRYKFDRKISQLDAAINLLSQILDERLQAERYRDAKEISQTVRELIDKRQQADRLLLERRANLTDLNRAQELKNQYDELIFNAVDMSKIRRHLTNQQANTLTNLRHF